jgi:hypothetical protein
MSVTEETLMAYADGELDGATRAEVEAAIEADPGLAKQLEAHRRLRAAIGSAFDPALTEPVPDRLMAAVRRTPSKSSAQIVALDSYRRPAPASTPRRWGLPQWGAVAASLFVGLVVGQSALLKRAGPIAAGKGGAMIAQGVLATALNDQLAADGAKPGQAVAIGVSFRADDKRLCRTFQIKASGLGGVACRDPDAWHIRAAVAAGAEVASEGGYRTAASPVTPALAAAVEGMIQGEPFDAKAEAAAKASGWRG